MQSQNEVQDPPDIKKYSLAIWSRRRAILVIALAAAVAAAGASVFRGTETTATATLFPPTAPAAEETIAPISDPRPLELLLQDPVLLAEAAQDLGISASRLGTQVSAETDATGALSITFAADDATAAQQGASTVAKTLADHQHELQQDALQRTIENLRARGSALRQQVATIDSRLQEGGRTQGRELSRALELSRDSLILQIVANATATAELQSALRSLQPPFIVPPSGTRTSGVSNLLRNTIIAAVGALVLGLLGAVVAEWVSDRVSGRSDLKRLIGAPVTTGIPLSGSFEKDVAFNEAVGAVRARIEASSTRASWISLLIASPRDADGKTTCVVELARSFAEAGQRCLILSSDLRDPRVESLLDVGPAEGLRDVIERGNGLQAAIKPTRVPGIFLLPSGTGRDAVSAVLKHDSLAKVLQDASSAYDVAIFDSPAVLTYADASFLAPLVDQVWIVVDVTTTSRSEVKRAVDELRATGGRVAGAIPNKVGSGRSVFRDLQI